MATEVLENGDWISFPTIVEENGELIDMGDSAMQHALDTGEYINFGADKKTALAFGAGAWKKYAPELGDR
jgi:hypothetical protein